MKLHIAPVAQFNTRWIHVVHSDVEEVWCEDMLTLEAAPVQAYLLTKQDSWRPPIGLFLTTGLVPDDPYDYLEEDYFLLHSRDGVFRLAFVATSALDDRPDPQPVETLLRQALDSRPMDDFEYSYDEQTQTLCLNVYNAMASDYPVEIPVYTLPNGYFLMFWEAYLFEEDD